MEHFSMRLARTYRDEDWLNRLEAAEVLTTNRGRPVKPEYVTELARQGLLHPDKSQPRAPLYQYGELKEYIVRSGSGRHKIDNPSPGALRKRKYVQRHGPKKVSQVE